MNKQFLNGLVDAVGFVAGALLGLFIAKTFGADPMGAGYGTGSVVGILLCGLGGGAAVVALGGLGLGLQRRRSAVR